MSGKTDRIARQGVEAVRKLFISEFGWYPREPVAPDYGVDIYVECAVDDIPDGRMLALQVKAGDSYFRESTDSGWTYRGSERHLHYWTGHALPVVLVLYAADDDVAYWQHISPETVEIVGAGWKTTVPRTQRLDTGAADALRALADGDPYIGYLNALRADSSWMRLLADGGSLALEVDEWVHKTSGRGEVRLLGTTHDGSSLDRRRTGYFGGAPYDEVLPLLFPWADLAVDEDVYDFHERAQWDLECGAYDSETGTYVVHSQPFDEWRASQPDLRPYESAGGGEVEQWRLSLTLNDLGKAFLLVDGFVADRLGS